jgi:molecular chaperone GrpE
MKKDKTKSEATEEVKEESAEVVETKEEQLQKALDEKNEQFLRICAEYDNFRKRSVKEKQDAYVLSKSDVIKELLPVLDNFDRAANNKESNFEDYKKGIDLIFNQFGEILAKLGVEAYGERGEDFDPNIHNAVMTVEDDELGENQIAAVFSKGYKMGDRIIREAVVQVANS